MKLKSKILIFSAVIILVTTNSYAQNKKERFVNQTNNDVAKVSNISDKISSKSKYLVKKISNIPAGYSVVCKELSDEKMCDNIVVSKGAKASERYIGVPNNEKAITYKYYLELIKGDNRLENHIVDFSDITLYPPYIFKAIEKGNASFVSTKDIQVNPNNKAIVIYRIDNYSGTDKLLSFDNPNALGKGEEIDSANVSSVEIENGAGVVQFQNNTCGEVLKAKNCTFSFKILNPNSNKVPRVVFKDVVGNEIGAYNIVINKTSVEEENVSQNADIKLARIKKLHRDSLYNVREIVNIPQNYTVACESNVLANRASNLQATENCINELIFEEYFHETNVKEEVVNAIYIATEKSNANKTYQLIFKNKIDGNEIPVTVSFRDMINGEDINQIEEYMYYAKPTIGLNIAPETTARKIYALTLNNKENTIFEITFNTVYRLNIENLKTLKSRNTAAISLRKVKPNGIKANFTQNYNDFFTVVNNTCRDDNLNQNKCYIEFKGKKYVDKNKIFLTMTNKDNYSQDFSVAVDMAD